MSCRECEDELEQPSGIYPYRVGNDEIGYGAIALIGCRRHVKLAMEQMRGAPFEEGQGLPPPL